MMSLKDTPTFGPAHSNVLLDLFVISFDSNMLISSNALRDAPMLFSMTLMVV